MDAAAVVPRAIPWRKSMTDIPALDASTRLYSQTNHDERGNFLYQGDLYRAGDNLATLAARIEGRLKAKFPDTRFAIRTEKFAGGRKIIAEILDTPTDLTPRDAQNCFFVKVRDQMERFGFTRSNLLQDFHHLFVLLRGTHRPGLLGGACRPTRREEPRPGEADARGLQEANPG